MKLRCVRAFGTSVPGDEVDGIPDGAAFDPDHWEAVTAEAPPSSTAPAAAPAEASGSALAALAELAKGASHGS